MRCYEHTFTLLLCFRDKQKAKMTIQWNYLAKFSLPTFCITSALRASTLWPDLLRITYHIHLLLLLDEGTTAVHSLCLVFLLLFLKSNQEMLATYPSVDDQLNGHLPTML